MSHINWELIPMVMNIKPQFHITTREHQVFAFRMAGMTTREISAELGVAMKTVEAYRLRLNRKFRVLGVGPLGKAR